MLSRPLPGRALGSRGRPVGLTETASPEGPRSACVWRRVALRGVPCTRGRPSRSSVRVGARRECRVPCGRLVACFCACARSGPLTGPCAHTSLESGTDPPSGELVSGGGRMAPGELRPRTRARHRPVQRPGSAPSFPEVLGTPRRPRPAAVAPHGGLGCEASACGVTTSRMKPHVTAGPGRRSGACLPAPAEPSAPCARVCAPRACPVSGRGAGSAPSFRRPARGRPQARTRSGGVRVAF